MSNGYTTGNCFGIKTRETLEYPGDIVYIDFVHGTLFRLDEHKAHLEIIRNDKVIATLHNDAVDKMLIMLNHCFTNIDEV